MSESPERPHQPPRRPGPRFSIVIPTYERPSQLAACLTALRALERPGDSLEIIVVNDGGTPPPASLVAVEAGDGGLTIRVLDQRNAGPGAARNTGSAAATGECLAFTDDDCMPDRGWLTALDAALRAAPNALVGGRTVNLDADDVYADASQRLADFTASWFAGGAAGRFFASNNMAVSRDAFLDAGGFDARFSFAGEDRELGDRWAASGRPSRFAADAVVRHAHALSLTRFVRQHFSYGRGAVQFRSVRADAGRPVRIVPTFYLRSIAFALRGGGGPARALARAAFTLVAHVAYAAGLFQESRRSRRGAR